ncbi:hypothetical protein [uncultured Maribacter sp.]|uniref:hypothetical protein n=1 Tax=uncultured Maribacter sp. TaxID=431308 RepID=UPI00263265F7|nr:hypothetical protein [uncultured Maribacter sp.]
MNYFILSYMALGFVFSLVIGIEYNCVGEEKFPEFYGSLFIFKKNLWLLQWSIITVF